MKTGRFPFGFPSKTGFFAYLSSHFGVTQVVCHGEPQNDWLSLGGLMVSPKPAAPVVLWVQISLFFLGDSCFNKDSTPLWAGHVFPFSWFLFKPEQVLLSQILVLGPK